MSDFGYDNDGHFEELERAFVNTQNSLTAVGDADNCQRRLDALLSAKKFLGEAQGHIESLEGIISPDEDARLSKRYQQLRDHIWKVRDNFGRLCVRRDD
jgi:hypothetical protein